MPRNKILVKTKNGKIIEKKPKPINFQTKLNIRIANEKFEKLKEIAKLNQISYSDIVRNLIDDYLNKEV